MSRTTDAPPAAIYVKGLIPGASVWGTGSRPRPGRVYLSMPGANGFRLGIYRVEVSLTHLDPERIGIDEDAIWAQRNWRLRPNHVGPLVVGGDSGSRERVRARARHSQPIVLTA